MTPHIDTSELIQPVIPEALLPYADEAFFAAHRNLFGQQVSTILESMPAPSRDPRGTLYVDLSPQTDHDRNSAILVPFPFAMGFDRRPEYAHMAVRMALMRDSLHEPRRIILLPNNSRQAGAYGLSSEERRRVASGDFSPVAERHVHVAEHCGAEQVHVFGVSQGAAVGAAVLAVAAKGYARIGPSGFVEPCNVMKRSQARLTRDFVAEGIAPLRKAINDSALPPLLRAHNVMESGLLPQVCSRIAYLRDVRIAENQSLRRGLAYDSFGSDLHTALSHSETATIMLASAAKSRLSRPEQIEELFSNLRIEFGGRVRGIGAVGEIIPVGGGYGHELTDNIGVHALLARLAIEGPAHTV